MSQYSFFPHFPVRGQQELPTRKCSVEVGCSLNQLLHISSRLRRIPHSAPLRCKVRPGEIILESSRMSRRGAGFTSAEWRSSDTLGYSGEGWTSQTGRCTEGSLGMYVRVSILMPRRDIYCLLIIMLFGFEAHVFLTLYYIFFMYMLRLKYIISQIYTITIGKST